MKSYEEATRIIIVLSYATSFRYYQNKKKSLSKFLLSWIYNVISFFTYVYFIFYLEICNLSALPYNKERITYTFLLFIFLYGYITITITGWYKSKVMDLQRSFRIFIFLWFFVPVSFSSSYILVVWEIFSSSFDFHFLSRIWSRYGIASTKWTKIWRKSGSKSSIAACIVK